MRQLLYGGGAASLQLASLFKWEIVGRFKILSILFLTMANEKRIHEHAGQQTVRYF